jgi:hypothetical protein
MNIERGKTECPFLYYLSPKIVLTSLHWRKCLICNGLACTWPKACNYKLSLMLCSGVWRGSLVRSINDKSRFRSNPRSLPDTHL